MNRSQFARKLVESQPAERRRMLAQNPRLCDVRLAKSLAELCYEVWTSEPQKVSAIVSTLKSLNGVCGGEEIKAYLEWTKGIESLVGGELEKCLKWLDKSEKTFTNLGETHSAATTQISKLYALALLGRYDEAVACGLRAREIFLDHSDVFSAGKVEHNIGNLYWRRDFYRESEPFLASARERFLEVKDQRQLAMVENCQAFVKALQNDFRAAEKIYGTALRRAKKNALTVTEAEIETGMSNLYLFQGKYDLALEFMERSRRAYETLGMPHQSAVCELEIADIYLELNLLAEAAGIYEQAAKKFASLGMQAELARCLLNFARAFFLSGEAKKSHTLLSRAEELFEAEGNPVSIAAAHLLKTQIYLREGDLKNAEDLAERARLICSENANPRCELLAGWLLGEIYIASGKLNESRAVIEETLVRARENFSPIEYFCLVSLGKIALRRKNLQAAEDHFRRAVALSENARSMLADDEIRTAFAGDKLLPYEEIVKLKLLESDTGGAFEWLERSRSRVLFELISVDPAVLRIPDGGKESALFAKYKILREELNWYYSRLNRSFASGLEARRKKLDLRKEATLREKELAEISRRLQISGNRFFGQSESFDVKVLQDKLRSTTVVEYFALDGKIGAFVLTEKSLRVYENLADVKTINVETAQFLFQIKTGRFFEKLDAANRQIAAARIVSYAQKLYRLLLAPIKETIKTPRLTFIPTGMLHYLPFQALHDGKCFLIEKSEIGFAPSAAVLNSSLQKNPTRAESALLVGIADRFNPAVKTEIKKVKEFFDRSAVLLNRRATLKNLSEMCGQFDVLHLACHGKFRPDNPLFSALELFGENLTARDVRGLDLSDKLVVLSACETGLNKIERGEELLGLTRGFLAAGTASLVMSLWTVDDKTTQELMVDFYARIRAGLSPAQALKMAQIKILSSNPHPYFWSSFILCGHY